MLRPNISDRCQLEENSLANRADQSEYGRVIWPEANANATVTVPCKGNHSSTKKKDD